MLTFNLAGDSIHGAMSIPIKGSQSGNPLIYRFRTRDELPPPLTESQKQICDELGGALMQAFTMGQHDRRGKLSIELSRGSNDAVWLAGSQMFSRDDLNYSISIGVKGNQKEGLIGKVVIRKKGDVLFTQEEVEYVQKNYLFRFSNRTDKKDKDSWFTVELSDSGQELILEQELDQNDNSSYQLEQNLRINVEFSEAEAA